MINKDSRHEIRDATLARLNRPTSTASSITVTTEDRYLYSFACKWLLAFGPVARVAILGNDVKSKWYDFEDWLYDTLCGKSSKETQKNFQCQQYYGSDYEECRGTDQLEALSYEIRGNKKAT